MKRVLTTLGLLFLFTSSLLAETPAANQAGRTARPRIGLVLSGGGALGLAHVGVLQWLEEHRIPVAYVGGTSMGGLVGGLFATGYDVAEMKAFVRSVNWASVFNPAPPFHDLAFRRKEDRREFPNNLQLGLKKGIRLPPALASGNEVGLVMSRFAAPYAEFRSFDDLPTPFRCVATNLVNGEQVVFKDGSLPIALRATMSLPAIFAPLEIDNMVLADGGMLNNLPVDVVKGMGADMTIAVALIDPEAEKKSLESLLGIAKRSIGVMIDANARRSMALADLVVAPDLAGLTSTDFSKFEEMEQRGYESAEKKKALLSTLSVSEEEYAQWVAERKRKRLPKTVTPTFVTVRGVGGPNQEALQSNLESKVKGEPVNYEVMDESLTEVAGLGPYSSATYGFVKRDGAEGVQVDVRRKTFAPPLMDTGINIEGSETANIRFGLGVRFTWFDFGAPNSELRTDATIGLTNSIGMEYYRRLGFSRWFIAPRGYYSRRQEDVYEEKTRTSILKVREAGIGSDFGLAVSRFQELRVGYQYTHVDPSVSSGEAIPELSAAATGYQTLRLRWSYDAQDSNIVPRHGIHSVLDGRWNYGLPTGYPQFGIVEERLTAATAFGPRYSLYSALAGGTILGPKAYLPPFTLGGPGNLSALARGQERGERYYYGAVHGLRAFSTDRSSYLNRVYMDVAFETGKAFSDLDFGKPIYDGALGVVAESPIGIIFIGWSYGSENNHKFFFRVGRLF